MSFPRSQKVDKKHVAKMNKVGSDMSIGFIY